MLFFLPSSRHRDTGWVRNSVAWVVGRFLKDAKLAGTVRAASAQSVHEFHRLVQQRDEYVRMFYREASVFFSFLLFPGIHSCSCDTPPALDQVWDKHGLDGIIAPVLAIPALPHG